MKTALISGFAATALAGAIFGFFYAWICSTMWGLDATDPRVAIQAMQAMNGSVRNIVFAPAFFGTPIVAALAGLAALRIGATPAAAAYGAGALIYAVGGIGLTLLVNVPMNDALGALDVPQETDAARAIWAEYSPRWQRFNSIRTGFSGLSLLLCGAGLFALGRAAA